MSNNLLCREDGTSAMAVRRRLGFAWSPGVAALLLVCLTSLAGAQQYQADPVDENAGKLKLTAEQCVKNPARFANDGAQFIEFFDKYYFPAMTRFAPGDLGQLGRMRDDLFSRFLWASTDENLQRELTEMAFKKVQPVERSSKYHPAVRYNAILILGMLDKTYATAGRPPVPLKAGTDELVLIVNYAADGKPVPPFLVVGALVGLERHAQYHDGLDRATIEAISSAASKFAAKDEPLPEVGEKVAQWMRIQAATVLANLGSPGPKREILAVLAKLIAGQSEPKMTLDGRGQVAALLKNLKYEGATVDGEVMADSLLRLAVAIADDEAKEAKAFEDTQVQAGGYGGGYGGAPRSKGRMKLDQDTQQWEYDSRILLSRLDDLKTGLSEFRAAAPADKQPVFDAVLAAIGPVVSAASSSDAVDIAVVGKVRTMATQIRTAVNPGTAPAADSDGGAVF